MSKTPIEMMLDGVEWVPCSAEREGCEDLPYATHEGVLEIGDFRLRCYRLSNGQAVFHADDIKAAFGDLFDIVTDSTDQQGRGEATA